MRKRAAKVPIYRAKPSIIFRSRPDVDLRETNATNVLDSLQQKNR